MVIGHTCSPEADESFSYSYQRAIKLGLISSATFLNFSTRFYTTHTQITQLEVQYCIILYLHHRNNPLFFAITSERKKAHSEYLCVFSQLASLRQARKVSNCLNSEFGHKCTISIVPSVDIFVSYTFVSYIRFSKKLMK